MKLERSIENPILQRNSTNPWEAGSVFNPNVIYDDGVFRMVYRATNDIKKTESGGYISSIGYAESSDGIHFTRSSKPLIVPDREYENGLGCEDPRVTKIEDTYFLYYTAVQGIDRDKKVRIALATSTDFHTWEKQGLVGPPCRSKAALLFSEKIQNQYVVFFTWMADTPLSTILQIRFDSIEGILHPSEEFVANSVSNFEQNAVFRPPKKVYRGPEVGAVPIKTSHGWLFIYCNANVTDHKEWTISAALLDLENPQKILSYTEDPIFSPEKGNEIAGVVPNVAFPSGALKVGDELFVYYGSGDQECCLATCNFTALIDYLVSKI